MNIYQMAKQTVENTQQWNNTIVIFETTSYKVFIARSQHGDLRMAVSVKGNLQKNAQVVKNQISVGCVGKFQLTEKQYQTWVTQVQKVL
jgi:hypothetical protein